MRIKDLGNTATNTDLINSNYIPLDGNAGSKKAPASILGNTMGAIAPIFDETRTAVNPYRAGELVTNWGRLYRCKNEHYGAWNASNFTEIHVNNSFAQYSRVPNSGYELACNYHFQISSGNKVDNSGYNTSVFPILNLIKNRPVAIENNSASGVRVAFLTSDPTILNSGDPVSFCNGTDVVVVYNRKAKLVDIPKDCQYVVIWAGASVSPSDVKFYSPVGISDKDDFVINYDSFWYDSQIISSGSVSVITAYGYITIRYDISKISEFYINYTCEFPSNFNNYKSIVVTDENNLVIDVIDDAVVKSSNNYVVKLENKKYSNSFNSNQIGYSAGAKYLYVTYKTVDLGSSFVFVSTSPISNEKKCFKKLTSTYHPGTFFYSGNYVTNWRLCADEYDVTDLKEVVIDHGISVSGGGPYEFLFKLSDNSYQIVFNRNGYTKYDAKILVPVPSNAVKLIVNSSMSSLKLPYHRTKVYSYVGNSYGDTSFEDINKEVKTIDLMFIGNSLTQDAVSYLPLLLKEVCPDIEFNIYMWYNGGYTLKQQWENKIDPNVNVACDIFSVCHTDIAWANAGVKMSAILTYLNIDYLVLQEYFNYVNSYSAADTQYFNDIVDYIASSITSKFEVDCLFHAPKRGTDFETIYQRTKDGNIVILKNTAAVDIFVPGCAIYEACSTSLDSLGDLGHLTPDGTHAQEGLPCLLEAYVMLLQILNKLGRPMTIEGVTSIVDNSNYSSINVPGPNLGNGVVVGSSTDYEIAKRVAAYSTNKKYAIMSETF